MCQECGKPSQRELCVLCQHEAEMARRQQPRGHVNPMTRAERDAVERKLRELQEAGS